MKTIRLTLYAFGELPEDKQQKVLTDHYDINVSDNWWDFLYTDAKEAGLSITGFDLDRDNYCHAQFIHDAIYTAGRVMDNHGTTTATYQTTLAFWANRNQLVNDWPKDENGELVHLLQTETWLPALNN